MGQTKPALDENVLSLQQGVRANQHRSRLSAAISDLLEGLRMWRSWWVLAINDVRMRYRRSRLGQFWLTISMGTTVLGVGIVFPVIMHQSVGSYIPFLGVGLIVWALISSTINDLTMSFVSSELFLKSYPGPRSVVVFRVILRNFVVNAHNLVLLPVIWIFFGTQQLNLNSLLVVPGLILILLNFIWIGLLLGPLSARFRDVPQIVQSVIQLMFFMTPIIYRPEQIEHHFRILSHYNPLANAVEIVRAPLLGEVPDTIHYLMVLSITLCGHLVALPFYARFRGRILYWL